MNQHITTSGMLGLMILLHHCKEVTAYGFKAGLYACNVICLVIIVGSKTTDVTHS
jgi:hypothetical protein